MAEVKWIKLDVDMFSNPKIKKIRRMPEGNNILLIWVMLLTMAGRCNASGMIFITQNIPYTIEDLADELGFGIDTTKLAIKVLEEMGMITTDINKLEIPGWCEHQNEAALSTIRDYEKCKKAEYRRKKNEEIGVSRTCPGQVPGLSYSISNSISNSLSLSNSIDIKKEYISNNNLNNTDNNNTNNNYIDNDNERIVDESLEDVTVAKKADKPIRNIIPPTVDMVRDYCFERNNDVDAERFVDFYTSKGWVVGKSKMKDWQAAVRSWEKTDKKSNNKASQVTKGIDWDNV